MTSGPVLVFTIGMEAASTLSAHVYKNPRKFSTFRHTCYFVCFDVSQLKYDNIFIYSEMQDLCVKLTLKSAIATAADDIHTYF